MPKLEHTQQLAEFAELLIEDRLAEIENILRLYRVDNAASPSTIEAMTQIQAVIARR